MSRRVAHNDVWYDLVFRQPQICGLTKRRVAHARRTERNRVGRVKGDRIESVKPTLPEHQYRDRQGVARLRTRRINVGGTLGTANRCDSALGSIRFRVERANSFARAGRPDRRANACPCHTRKFPHPHSGRHTKACDQ